jgi:hypothetical protein
VDALFAILVLSSFALLPIIGSACFAWVAITAFHSNQIKTTRWMTLPFFLLAFSLICLAVAAWTLSFSPNKKPGLLNPILVFLVLDGVFLLPVALITLIRGLVVLRASRLEAGLDLIAVVLFALLYFPYVALHDYYPHV